MIAPLAHMGARTRGLLGGRETRRIALTRRERGRSSWS